MKAGDLLARMPDKVYRELEGEFVLVGYCRNHPRAVIGETGQYIGPVLEEDVLIPDEKGWGDE